MSTQAQFDKAVEIVGNLPKEGKPSQEEQLAFYANFKQGKEGDVTSSRPGMMDFVGKYKWDAWKKLEGTPKEDAQKAYVKLLKEKLEAAGDEKSKENLAALEAAGQ